MAIENAKITHADLSMADHGVLCYELTLEGRGWGCVYGSRVIGKGYLGAKDFEGYASGIEAIMLIMDTVGVSRWSELNGKYVRVEMGSWGDPINRIGHVIEDKWFDQQSFFDKAQENGE